LLTGSLPILFILRYVYLATAWHVYWSGQLQELPAVRAQFPNLPQRVSADRTSDPSRRCPGRRATPNSRQIKFHADMLKIPAKLPLATSVSLSDSCREDQRIDATQHSGHCARFPRADVDVNVQGQRGPLMSIFDSREDFAHVSGDAGNSAGRNIG